VVSRIASPLLMNAAPSLLRRMASQHWLLIESSEELKQQNMVPLKDHVILCGFGRIGRNLGLALRAREIPFVVIELDGEIIQELKDNDIPCIYGDSLSKVVLLKANLKQAQCLVLTLPDPLGALTVIDFARRYNPALKILARVHRPQDIEVFRAAGANAVVQPEFECSVELARLALAGMNVEPEKINESLNELRRRRHRQFQPDIAEPLLTRLFGFDEDKYVGLWFIVNAAKANETTAQLGQRNRSGATILAIKRGAELIPHPDVHTTVTAGDELYVVGTPSQLTSFEESFALDRFCPLDEMGADELALERRS
ncbi:MAG TPA: NAD-binding protein, partial [Candidatus Obscuribacterales bacterium]